jgi:hypothetical protein
MPGINLQYGNISTVTRTALTTTARGNAQVDTADFQFADGSALFQANGDAITLNTSTLLVNATSERTQEFWFKDTNTARVAVLLWAGVDNSSAQGYWQIFLTAGTTTSTLNIGIFPGTLLFSTTITRNTNWNHFAWTTNGNTNQIFYNGVSLGTFTRTASLWTTNTNEYNIGAQQSSSYANGIRGWIDEFRVSSIVRYTSNFTPTGPFVNDANTVLLLHMNGTDGSQSFPDDNLGTTQGGLTLQYGDIQTATRTAIATASVNGGQVSTAQSVFGGASGLFSSVNSGVTATNAGGALTFGTGDFTYEMRYRPISKVTSFPAIFFAPYGGNFVGGAYNLMDRHNNNPNNFTFWVGNFSTPSPLLVSTTTVSNGQWYALAVTRSGNTFRLFVNGVLEATATFAGSLDNNTMSVVGIAYPGSGSNAYINGYIDELRVSNIARYTATYTPATQTFVNDANTRLLLHMDGANGSTSFPDDNVGTTAGGLTITY